MREENALTVADGNAAGGQLQVYDMSKVLTMPKEQFVEFFMQPVQDDTWIRTEDIVKMEDYIATPGGEEIKKEILKEYIEKRAALGIKREDKILEGMAYQEKVIENYILNEQDKASRQATGYRKFMMTNFRRRHPSYKPTAPFGEEPFEEKKGSDSDDEDEAQNAAPVSKSPEKSENGESIDQPDAASPPAEAEVDGAVLADGTSSPPAEKGGATPPPIEGEAVAEE